MSVNLGGHPKVYTKEIAREICLRVANGETVRQICKDPGMPNERTVRNWIVDNSDGFFLLYMRAKEAQADYYAEEIIDIADNSENDWMQREGKLEVNGEHIARARLRVDSRKWLMARMAPKRWGDKLENIISGDPNNPVHTRTEVRYTIVDPVKIGPITQAGQVQVQIEAKPDHEAWLASLKPKQL